MLNPDRAPEVHVRWFLTRKYVTVVLNRKIQMKSIQVISKTTEATKAETTIIDNIIEQKERCFKCYNWFQMNFKRLKYHKGVYLLVFGLI